MRRAALVLMLAAAAAGAQERPAPAPHGNDTRGKPLSFEAFGDRTVVLLFHSDRTTYSKRAVEAVVAGLAARRALHAKVGLLLVTSSADFAGDTLEPLVKPGIPAVVASDPERTKFDKYHVVAFPTAFVIDPERRIARTIKGFGPRFADLVVLGAELASGVIDRRAYDAATSSAEPPRPDAAHLELARTMRMVRRFIAAGLIDAARKSLEKVVTPETDSTGAIVLMARLLIRQSEHAEAQPWVDRLAKLAPDSADLALLRAELALHLGKLKRAESILSGASDSNPKVLFLRGRIREKQGRYKEAAKDYRRALDLLLAKSV